MMSAVFLDYDQAALDREYDNMKKVAEVATITAAWDDRGAEARRHLAAISIFPMATRRVKPWIFFRPPSKARRCWPLSMAAIASPG